MARGRNAESGNERRFEDHRPHAHQRQDLVDRSSGRESLKGCPVGQPANEDRNYNMNRDDRNGLIAKHRLDKQGSELGRDLPDNEQHGLGKTCTKMDHSLKEAGAGPHTVHENDDNDRQLYLKGAYNFDSSGRTAASRAHGHHEFAHDQVDGVRSDGSNQPTRHQETIRISASSNQYQIRNLNTERDRLSTYFDWPNDIPVTAEDLARQGFFYLGDRDRVECAFCGGVLHQWEAGDDPFIEHQRHYSHCPFVNGEATANVPLGATSHEASQPTGSQSTTQSVVINQTSQRSSTPAHVTQSQVTQGTASGTTSVFALPIGTEWPKQPDFADEQSRLSTFHNWPRYSPLSPLMLVRAGFLYTYVADHVRCFWCDGGLKDWQQDDDPWEEHARWYGPECGYVIMNKGMDYIREVRTRRPPIVQQPQYRWGVEASIIQSILEMGFDEGMIQAVVQNQWQRYNRPFTTATELLTALLPQEEPQYYPADEEEPPFTFQSAPVVPPTPTTRLTPMDEQPLDPETMERELRRLREERQCKVCLSADACMVFIPCGHLCCCEHCANMLRMRGRRCPLCRALFQRVQRAFLA